MEILFKPSFIKDFKKFSGQIKIKVEKICFIDFQKAKNFSDEILKIYSIKSLTGFSGYYRIRIGDYRIGFKIEREKVIFMRVLHRKDIYKFFP